MMIISNNGNESHLTQKKRCITQYNAANKLRPKIPFSYGLRPDNIKQLH